ncbi:MAG: 2-hydroxyhepta-2,4-diene-1,7-dioate isomerase [Saprospiraceae bacterium]|nr:2-hydroxyhepta-2,4-diene-1,7-dioate isomerase [Saprospiraceae bacterium]
MKLYYGKDVAYLEKEGNVFSKKIDSWDELINRTGLSSYLVSDLENWQPKEDEFTVPATPPIQSQEIWASGVTYLRSKTARMAEAEEAGGGDFYDRVYDAPRPELFMKGTAARTVGEGGTVYIRKDSTWNVPEPELTLFISAEGTIEGYTIGNDMSSRSIEGENPLYLPQAKVYDNCAGLGPCIYVTDTPIPQDTTIRLEILRRDKVVFDGSIQIDQIKRKFEDLVEYLYRACSFPYGCFLMTGTGIVPPDHFSLNPDDEIRIHIDHIGTLTNAVQFCPERK